jgi:hypothetical protein
LRWAVGSPTWRRRLLAARPGTLFYIDAATLAVGHRSTDRDIRRFELKYAVSTIPLRSGSEQPLHDGGLIVFRFVAREFPEVNDTSWNNPAAS